MKLWSKCLQILQMVKAFKSNGRLEVTNIYNLKVAFFRKFSVSLTFITYKIRSPIVTKLLYNKPENQKWTPLRDNMQWLKSKRYQNKQCSLYHNQWPHGPFHYCSESPWLFSLSKLAEHEMVKQVTTKYHLPTYCIDRVVRYFQNVTFASTVSLIPTYCSNNLSHPALSGIIVFNPAQNCQNKIGPGNALQDMKFFTLVLVGMRLWSKMLPITPRLSSKTFLSSQDGKIRVRNGSTNYDPAYYDPTSYDPASTRHGILSSQNGKVRVRSGWSFGEILQFGLLDSSFIWFRIISTIRSTFSHYKFMFVVI